MRSREGEFDQTHIPRAAKVLSCRRALAVMLKHHGYMPPEPGASPQALRIRSEIVVHAKSAVAACAERRRQERLERRRECAARRRARAAIDKAARISLADLITAVASFHGAPIADIMRRHSVVDRGSPHALAVAEIAYRAYHAGYRLGDIGRALGGRDHTTVRHQISLHVSVPA